MTLGQTKKKFLVFAPHFAETNGGTVCLHKLCDELNNSGQQAWLVPFFRSHEAHRLNAPIVIRRLLTDWYKARKKLVVNPAFNTPVFDGTIGQLDLDDYVVVYGEGVFGNPLAAKHIVRWFLHTPGYHSHQIYYGINELYFNFNSGVREFNFPWSTTSKSDLKVIHYPLEHYNLGGASKNRKGTAYCLRKGKGKQLIHDDPDAILIDGKSHAEVSKIFKSVERFVSYDIYTAYSVFAVLCGCQSIVASEAGISETEWYPDQEDRYGIAYGFDKIEYAENTAHLVKERILKEHEKNAPNVAEFVRQCEDFFSKPKLQFSDF